MADATEFLSVVAMGFRWVSSWVGTTAAMLVELMGIELAVLRDR